MAVAVAVGTREGGGGGITADSSAACFSWTSRPAVCMAGLPAILAMASAFEPCAWSKPQVWESS